MTGVEKMKFDIMIIIQTTLDTLGTPGTLGTLGTPGTLGTSNYG